MPDNELYTEIYPRLFERINEVLPEFGFRRFTKGWVSSTPDKVTGELGKNGKVYVYDNNIHRLKDFTRESVTIWDYIQNKEGIATNGQVLKRLAELANYSLTSTDLSEEALRSITSANHKAKLWEDANSFFARCLSHKENTFANSPGAASIRDYLINQRGYKPALFLAPDQKPDQDNLKMEVGYVPSLFDLQAYLVDERGYSINEAKGLITDARIGDTHRLAIPYRDPSGRIRGMVFRSTTNAEPKYLYSAGLEKKAILFNLKAITGTKDVVIVEGVLDALHATAVGIPNVVAIGGSGDALTREHIEAAIRYGARKITLLLDNDKAGYKGVDKALVLLLQFPQIRPYVAFVEEQHKDLDKLLTLANGPVLAQQVIREAISGWEYLLNRLLDKYADIEESSPNGKLEAKDRDDLQAALTATSALLSVPDGEQFIKAALNNEAIADYGIKQQTLEDISDRLREQKAREERKKATKNLLSDAQQHLADGQENKALDLLRTKSREIKESDRVNEFTQLNAIFTEVELSEQLRTKPDSLESGFSFTDYKGEPDPIVIPSGQITILAGATSHGKTVLLTNLALNLCALYPKKTFHVFTYETDRETYLVNALNAYIGDGELAYNNRESIEHFFRKKDKIIRTNRLTNEVTKYPLWRPGKETLFNEKRQTFFSDLIDEGRLKVHYVDYDSDKLINAIHHLLKTEPLGAVLTDYVQLINLPQNRNKGYSRQEEIKRMCQDFQEFANDTGVPLVFAAQFNREVTNMAQMHATKLGEAGDLERIANLIIGLWNNKFPGLNPSKEEKITIEKRLGKDPDPNIWYVEALKRRGGEVGAWDIWNYDAKAGKVTSNRTL